MNIFRAYIEQIRKAPLDKDTKGPVNNLGTKNTVTVKDTGVFENGRYLHAKWKALHPGRLGPHIDLSTIVVHTTDTPPGGFNAIVKSWTETAGLGNAATFLLGQTPEDGLVQFASIYNNTNHAGGAKHGWWTVPGVRGSAIHPNSISVGIEVDNAGKLTLTKGGYLHKDTGKLFPRSEVYAHTDGSFWHKITDYQREQLKFLIADLRAVIGTKAHNYTVVPNGAYKDNQAMWAVPVNPELLGHASLDPYNKTDPGPEIMELINKW